MGQGQDRSWVDFTGWVRDKEIIRSWERHFRDKGIETRRKFSGSMVILQVNSPRPVAVRDTRSLRLGRRIESKERPKRRRITDAEIRRVGEALDLFDGSVVKSARWLGIRWNRVQWIRDKYLGERK